MGVGRWHLKRLELCPLKPLASSVRRSNLQLWLNWSDKCNAWTPWKMFCLREGFPSNSWWRDKLDGCGPKGCKFDAWCPDSQLLLIWYPPRQPSFWVLNTPLVVVLRNDCTLFLGLGPPLQKCKSADEAYNSFLIEGIIQHGMCCVLCSYINMLLDIPSSLRHLKMSRRWDSIEM